MNTTADQITDYLQKMADSRLVQERPANCGNLIEQIVNNDLTPELAAQAKVAVIAMIHNANPTWVNAYRSSAPQGHTIYFETGNRVVYIDTANGKVTISN